MTKILFLCRGNVGRSQMAEALFKKQFGDAYEVISAGTKLSGPEEAIGNLTPAINEVLEVMKEEGLDVSNSIRTQVTPELANYSDKIIAILEDTEELPEYLKDSPKVTRWTVTDPKGMDLDGTRKVKDEIKDLISKNFN